MYVNFDFRSYGQICIYANLRICKLKFALWSPPGANFMNLHMVQILHTCANPFTWADLHT